MNQAGESGKCGAQLPLLDDFGANECTFTCELPAGHEGWHRETMLELDDNEAAVIKWGPQRQELKEPREE